MFGPEFSRTSSHHIPPSQGSLRHVSPQSPSVERLHVFELVKEGAIAIHGNQFIPDPEFSREIAHGALTGTLYVVSFPHQEVSLVGEAQRIREEFVSSTLVNFQLRLAAEISSILEALCFPRSHHAEQVCVCPDATGAWGQYVPGFTSHCAKILPVHRDLAWYGEQLNPAFVSLIAWGGANGLPTSTRLHFVNLDGIESSESDVRLLESKPELEVINSNFTEKRMQQGLACEVVIPDFAITIFGNHNRAHGALWKDFQAGRPLNRVIQQESQAGRGAPVTLCRPIHVVLL